jgi:hypothetical protein
LDSGAQPWQPERWTKKGDAEMSNKDQSKKKEKTNKPKLTVKEKQDKKKAKKKGE